MEMQARSETQPGHVVKSQNFIRGQASGDSRSEPDGRSGGIVQKCKVKYVNSIQQRLPAALQFGPCEMSGPAMDGK